MSLITRRVKRWNEVIGQDRMMRVLHAILRQPSSLTRGIIFEGPYGVGKTTCAYLMARALMCIGDDPLGCRSCPSCLTADASLNDHPSFTEVDAASHSGVQATRDLMASLEGPANLGKRHVVIIDEAHRLSNEAWDVFLKPLELDDSEVIVLFLTTAGDKIPDTITSRCALLRFGSVSTDDLTGKLMQIADAEKMPYTAEGLHTVARFANGRPRDAVKALQLVAAVGEVTKATADSVLNQDAETAARNIFSQVLFSKIPEAVALADELAQRIGPVRVVQTMFTVFSQELYHGGPVTSFFAALPVMTSFFLKWAQVPHLPSDVIPLFILELSEARRLPQSGTTTQQQVSTARAPQAGGGSTSVQQTQGTKIGVDEFRKRMGS